MEPVEIKTNIWKLEKNHQMGKRNHRLDPEEEKISEVEDVAIDSNY